MPWSASARSTFDNLPYPPPDEAVRARFPGGAPEPLADAVLDAIARMRTDTAGFRIGTVRRLLGRAPDTFAEWCARHARVFREAVGG